MFLSAHRCGAKCGAGLREIAPTRDLRRGAARHLARYREPRDGKRKRKKEKKNMLEIITALTADAPTSKVHARMTQPTLIFAEISEEETKEALSPGGVEKERINSRSPVVSLLDCRSERTSLAVWRKSAAEG